jgi:cyclase
MLDWADFPDDFAKFELDPTGCELTTEELGPGVYALMSSLYNVDNAGFIVGDKGVLVIDAHICVAMAEQILARVRDVTDKPIRYLVNGNYHGDHTFGNCAFPAETLVIQHRETALRTPWIDDEKAFLLPTVGDNPALFEDVSYRAPDIIFDDHLTIDLGGQIVELYWFGPANTPGDTITYAPAAKAAWTGNMTVGAFGLALESDAPTYLATLARFAQTLELETLVSGHAPLSDADVIGRYMLYFSGLTNGVKKAIGAGLSLAETEDCVALPEAFAPPPSHPRPSIVHGRHKYNVRKTYLSLVGGT